MKRLKGSIITFLIASLICVPLLTFIRISGEEGVLNYILYVLMAASALLMLVFSLSSPEYPSFLPSEKRSAGAGIASLIAAAAHGGVGIFGIIHPEKRLFGTSEAVLETTIDSSGQVVTDVVTASETFSTIGIIYIAIMLVMAVTFLFYAFGFFSGKNFAGSYVMVPFIPILGSIVRVVLTFLQNASGTDMGANYLETLIMVFLMLFFVSSAKLTVGSAGNASKWAIGSGSAAMFFILLGMVDPVMSIVNKEHNILTFASETHFASDFSLVLFILGYCLYIANTDIEDYLEEINEDEDEGYGGPVSSKPTLLTGRNAKKDNTYIPEIAMVTTVMPSAQTKAPGMQVAKSGTAYSAPVPPRRDGVPTGGARQQARQRAGYSAPVPPRRVPIGYRLEADELTTRGAGMQVAEQFRVQRNEARRRTTNLLRYDGLDAFRAEMKGGRTALDVLESSRNAAAEEDTSLIGIKPINPFQQGGREMAAEPSVDPVAAQQMGEELQKDVEKMYDVADRRKGGDRRKGEAVGGRRSTDIQPEEVIAAPDESAPDYEEPNQIIEEPENEYRDVKLANGSLDSKMKKRRASDKETQQPDMQQNPYQQNMNGMNMGMGYGMGMGMGMGYGMGMGMNNPYDPYAGMGMNNPYANPYGGANPYAGAMNQMPFGSNNMYAEDSDEYEEDYEDGEYYEDDYYYDDEYDVETADSEEYDEEYEEDYEDGEYYDDDEYVEYDSEYDDEYDEYDEYDDYDEGDEYYGDDDSDYYDDEESYGTYDMSAQGWE